MRQKFNAISKQILQGKPKEVKLRKWTIKGKRQLQLISYVFMIEIYWLMHSKVYAWMSAQYVALYHVFEFWISYNDLLEAHFWYQISIFQICNFPRMVMVAIYMLAWCWKSQLFLASWFLVISKMKIHWLNTVGW